MAETTTPAAAIPTAQPLESPTLLRRHSIATSVVVPNKLTIPATPSHRSDFLASPNQNQNTQTQPSSYLNLDFVSIKSPLSSYTSLKDVLPSTNVAVNSPTATATSSRYEISIRNRLVKQAAWAYLQPMSASLNSSPCTVDFLRRLWHRFSAVCRRNPVTACLNFIYHQLVPEFSRIFQRILHAIRGQVRT